MITCVVIDGALMFLDFVCSCLRLLDLVALLFLRSMRCSLLMVSWLRSPCNVAADWPPFAARRCERGLSEPRMCSTFVLMEVETLGVARSLGWRVHMRCADGYREFTRSMRRCVYRKQLDLETLVATRGPNFPLSRLESRLMCPSCGVGG